MSRVVPLPFLHLSPRSSFRSDCFELAPTLSKQTPTSLLEPPLCLPPAAQPSSTSSPPPPPVPFPQPARCATATRPSSTVSSSVPSILVCAVDAWEKLEPAFKAVDLIELRRRKGTLETESATRVVDVPSEVWGIVKQELAAIEVEDAQDMLLDQLRCFTCNERVYKARTLSDLLACDRCRGEFGSGSNMQDYCIGREEALDKFLASYRLYLPSNRIVTEEPYPRDWDALSGIAFSLSRDKRLPSASPESNEHHGIFGHEVQPFETSPFTSLPPSAPSCIRHFVELFRLEVVDPASYLAGTSPPSAGESKESEARVEPK